MKLWEKFVKYKITSDEVPEKHEDYRCWEACYTYQKNEDGQPRKVARHGKIVKKSVEVGGIMRLEEEIVPDRNDKFCVECYKYWYNREVEVPKLRRELKRLCEKWEREAKKLASKVDKDISFKEFMRIILIAPFTISVGREYKRLITTKPMVYKLYIQGLRKGRIIRNDCKPEICKHFHNNCEFCVLKELIPKLETVLEDSIQLNHEEGV